MTSYLPENVVRALPELPETVREVLAAAMRDRVSIEEVASAVARDEVLAAHLQGFFAAGLGQAEAPTSSLRTAIAQHGIKGAYFGAMILSLPRVFPDVADAGYWKRSLIRATSARILVELRGSLLGEEAFLCGAMADLGALVLASCMPEEYAAYRSATATDHDRSEQEHFACSSDQVTQALLESWDLPAGLIQVIEAHMDPEKDPIGRDRPELQALLDALVTSELIASVCTDETADDALHAALLADFCERYALPSSTLTDIADRLDADVRRMGEILSVPLHPTQTCRARLADRT